MVDRHKILSPIAGVVVEIRAHKGEAVQPSQAVIHVVKLDSLWVEGDVPAAKFRAVRAGGAGRHGRRRDYRAARRDRFPARSFS